MPDRFQEPDLDPEWGEDVEDLDEDEIVYQAFHALEAKQEVIATYCMVDPEEYDALKKRAEAADAEVTRLRETLRHIAEWSVDPHFTEPETWNSGREFDQQVLRKIVTIAREALKVK